MTEPLEPEVAPATMICVIPRTPAATDDLSLQQIYDNQAQYLDTLRRQPSHDELAQIAMLHGFQPALPLSATQWTNQYAQRVIMVVASYAEPQFHNCDHGRSTVLGRRPFRGPLRNPPIPGAHRHYAELRRCRNCGGLQMVNVGPSGEQEASAWFQAADDYMPWRSLHDAAVAAGSPNDRG